MRARAVAKDSSGSGLDGTIAGATWVVPGAGAGDLPELHRHHGTVTNVAAGTGLNGKSAVTFSMWIKAAQAAVNTDSGFLNCETTPSGNDNQCDMRFDAAGDNGGGVQVFKMGVTSTSGLQQYEAANNTENTNWTHVCMTWQGGVGIKFYINGKLDTPTNVQAVNTGTISGNTSFVIGQSGKNSAAPTNWNGYIDDVRVYTTALTASQVADLLSFTSADAASAPSPADKATDVVRDVVLGWTAAASAQTHTCTWAPPSRTSTTPRRPSLECAGQREPDGCRSRRPLRCSTAKPIIGASMRPAHGHRDQGRRLVLHG